MNDLQDFLRAAAFAARKHRLQRRKNAEGSPYMGAQAAQHGQPIDSCAIIPTAAQVVSKNHDQEGSSRPGTTKQIEIQSEPIVTRNIARGASPFFFAGPSPVVVQCSSWRCETATICAEDGSICIDRRARYGVKRELVRPVIPVTKQTVRRRRIVNSVG